MICETSLANLIIFGGIFFLFPSESDELEDMLCSNFGFFCTSSLSDSEELVSIPFKSPFFFTGCRLSCFLGSGFLSSSFFFLGFEVLSIIPSTFSSSSWYSFIAFCPDFKFYIEKLSKILYKSANSLNSLSLNYSQSSRLI